MAQYIPSRDLDRQTTDTLHIFLKLVQENTEEEVNTFLSSGTRRDSQEDRKDILKQLEKVLNEENVVEAWKLIVEAQKEKVDEVLENLSDVCRIVTKVENARDNGFSLRCIYVPFKKLYSLLKHFEISWIKRPSTFCDHIKNWCNEFNITDTEIRSEKEHTWIKILSNPLYISLEWLWRNNPPFEVKKGKGRKESEFEVVSESAPDDEYPLVKKVTSSEDHSTDSADENKNRAMEYKGRRRRKEGKLEDVIQAALDDAYLLEKIASHEHHFSRDEYMDRAMEYEKFAADIVEQVNCSQLNQLHKIMDVEGKGALLKKKPDDFIHSLSLLKMAADKKRKEFVTSPKCQYILNEIIYHGSPGWRDKSICTKTLWFFLQLIFVIVTIPFYILLRLVRKSCMCSECGDSCWKVRMLYEHPYSKFMNHTMSYVLFLCLIFASSFEYRFGPGGAGLTWIDYAVIPYIIGLLLQELQEGYKQGPLIYYSKWWNVVDTLIVFTFLLAYTVWLIAWGFYGKWRPEKIEFIVADAIYSSASVMAFFHLAHFFQVNSVLGPLQLSLYRMLRDVFKFLAIFLLLYVAFSTGVAKIYSYYVASEMELQKQDNSTSYHQLSHPFALHANTFIRLFWLLFGGGGEEKSISVTDRNFNLITDFGRVFMGAYVICTVIVALNMLIAMMNNSFNRIMKNADKEWKFSRTRMWLEWIDKGNTIPVPFNIPYVLLRLFFLFVCGCCKSLRCEKKACCCIPRCNFGGCNLCKKHREKEETSIKEERIDVMKILVVEYLKERYRNRWKELMAMTNSNR